MDDGEKIGNATYTYSEISLTRNVYQIDGVDYKLSLDENEILTVKDSNGEAVDDAVTSNFRVEKVDVKGYENDDNYQSGYLVFYNDKLISPTIDLCAVENAYVTEPKDAKAPNFEITNETGIFFQKVDEEESPLTGADIVLQAGTITNGAFEEDQSAVDWWNWSSTDSSTAFGVDKLKDSQLYRIYEVTPPEGYDYQNDLYLAKIDDTVYWTSVAHDTVRPERPQAGLKSI